VQEAETDALSSYLREWPLRLSSVLAAVEVPRAATRALGDVSTAVTAVLELVNLVELDRRVLESAAALEPVELRTLDAVHLATALSLGDIVGTFLTYDERLRSAAETAGLATLGPA
jgi:predicted nucleic acid-binding protein